MTTDFALIGKRIAAIRKGCRMTQETLAEKLDMSSVYISHIENSRSIPSLETLVKLCDALAVTPDEVLTGTKKQSRDYMLGEIGAKLANCTPREKKMVSDFIDLLSAWRTE